MPAGVHYCTSGSDSQITDPPGKIELEGDPLDEGAAVVHLDVFSRTSSYRVYIQS